MYRFLLTPRWLGALALTLVAAAVMVFLGNWQLDRYRGGPRSTSGSTRASGWPGAARRRAPRSRHRPGDGRSGPAEDKVWTRVTVSGRYDPTNTVLVRGRTVDSRVGFEVLTRWCSPTARRCWWTGAGSRLHRVGDRQPAVPAAPTGDVTVVGRVHETESGAGAVARRDGTLEIRRIGVSRLAGELPYPVYGAYLLLDEQTPAADPLFKAVPVGHTNNWQNFGYVVQWWLFAVMALFGYGWVARREARRAAGIGTSAPLDRAAEPAPSASA
ncbi:SURF1 family protein [Micromonospora sp. M12]